MIQRIQTIFLSVSVILLALIYWLPLAEITASGELYLFDIVGIHKADKLITSGLPLVLFLLLIQILHFVVIFLFKKRILQIRLLIIAMIALFGLSGLFLWFAYMGFKGGVVSFKIAAAFPFIAIVLDYLAIRAIGKDEALVRSLNRIR